MRYIALLLPLILMACTDSQSKPSPSASAPETGTKAPAAIASSGDATASKPTAVAASSAGAAQTITALQFQKMIADNPDYIVLDVRTPAEFSTGHLPGAILMDVHSPDFAKNIAALDSSKTYLVYCRTGRRSVSACEKLTAINVASYNLDGGITAWVAAKFPTTQP